MAGGHSDAHNDSHGHEHKVHKAHDDHYDREALIKGQPLSYGFKGESVCHCENNDEYL
jgi:hypothetical protein